MCEGLSYIQNIQKGKKDILTSQKWNQSQFQYVLQHISVVHSAGITLMMKCITIFKEKKYNKLKVKRSLINLQTQYFF